MRKNLQKESQYENLTDLHFKFCNLYNDALKGKVFDDLSELILSRDNILLAYKTIKSLIWSNTVDYNNDTIDTISNLSVSDVINKLYNMYNNLIPTIALYKKPHKYSNIQKDICIPSIWDRLLQQCIIQVLNPICEAQFSNNSYGYRLNRCAEHAIAAIYNRLQLDKLHYVITINISDLLLSSMNRSKMIRQLWTLGIRDKNVLYILRQYLKTPIQYQDHSINNKISCGIIQAGILSELFLNISLNEFDHWIESQWQNSPIIDKYKPQYAKSGNLKKSNAYTGMRNRTKLKEVYIVRYGADIVLFCRNKETSNLIKYAVIDWFKHRLRINIDECIKCINTRHKYFEMLGFKIKVHLKANKYVVESHISDKCLKMLISQLKDQIKKMRRPTQFRTAYDELRKYNQIVLKVHDYYKIATHINPDLSKAQYEVDRVLINRLQRYGRGKRLTKFGRFLTNDELRRFKNSKMIWYDLACNKEPIYPIGYIQHQNPKNKLANISNYITSTDDDILLSNRVYNDLIRLPSYTNTIEYISNKISLYLIQDGRCKITNNVFISTDMIHCHHINPKQYGIDNSINNMILIDINIHKLIHAKDNNTIQEYINLIHLTNDQLKEINYYRKKLNLNKISSVK